jgi:2-haloacid dehalogenase
VSSHRGQPTVSERTRAERRRPGRPLSIQAIAFDLYATLVDVRSVERACSMVTDDAPGLAALWRRKQLEYTWLRTLMGQYEDFWAVTVDALDHALRGFDVKAGRPARDRLMAAWLDLEPFPEVAGALERLAARYRLQVLSNGTLDMIRAAVRAAGLMQWFTDLLSVDAVGRYKPSPEAYSLATEKLGVEPGNTLFVSANGWDVAGAGAAGFRVAWINRGTAPSESLDTQPDFVLRDMSELPDIVL